MEWRHQLIKESLWLHHQIALAGDTSQNVHHLRSQELVAHMRIKCIDTVLQNVISQILVRIKVNRVGQLTDRA